jgi:hypothetical protein
MSRYAIFHVTSFLLAAGPAGFTFAQMQPGAQKGPEMSMPSTDDRQPVAVSEATRIFVLTEMRGMLASVQGVTEAVAKRDWQAVVDAAGRSGLKAFQGMPKQVMMELPEEFRGMGKEAHMAFDAVVGAATANPEASAVSAKLADALQFCIACHQTYRFAFKN